MSCRPLLPLILAALLVSAPVVAAPVNEDAHKRAAESFHQAQAAFAQRAFAAAAASFEQAAEFEPHPAALVNAAEAWELAGDPAHAAAACDRVLALPDASPEFRADVQQRLTRLEPRIATVDLRGLPTWSVRLDAQAQVPLPSTRRIAPGRHTLTFVDALTGEARKVEVDLGVGELRTMDVPPRAVPAARLATHEQDAIDVPREPTARSRAAGPPPGSWIAFGGAAVASGVAGVFGLRTLGARRDFEETPTDNTRDTFYRERAVTNVAWGLAAVGVLVGALVWWTADRGSPAPELRGR